VDVQKKSALRQGNIVIGVLAILTIVEFFIAIELDSVVLLFIVALIKAALVVQFFMHVYRLWREENH